MKYMNLALLLPFVVFYNTIQTNEIEQHHSTEHHDGSHATKQGKIILGEHNAEIRHLIATFIDGTPFGVKANDIHVMMLVRQKIMEIILGAQDPVTKTRKGLYLYKDKLYSVRDMMKLEKTLAPEDHDEFYAVLDQVKKDFELFVAPFMAQAEGTKSQMIRLIHDSCTQRNRLDSLLLRWAEEKPGQEASIFNNSITTFHDFATFSMDLVHFLEDLMHSCPKAWAQFQDMMKERTAQQ